MKRYVTIIFFVMIILGFNNSCSANPLSKIMSLFQKDLKMDVVYKNHQNLIQGSEVYFAEDLEGQRILIGTVSKVSLVESQLSKVEIIVDKEYKEKIDEATLFVLMSNLFSKNSNAYIVAVPSSDASGKTPLKSGSEVKGVTFLEYKIFTAEGELKKIIDRFKQQNYTILNQLREYIDTVNTEAFQKKIDELVNQILQFSAEQKETFKKEMLPELRKMFDSIKEQLEGHKNKEKSKDLEKQFQEIKDIVEA